MKLISPVRRLSSNQTKLLHQTMQTPEEDALIKTQAQVESQVAPVGVLGKSTLDGRCGVSPVQVVVQKQNQYQRSTGTTITFASRNDSHHNHCQTLP